MKQMLISLAKTLVRAAADRAEYLMFKQAGRRGPQREDYSANAGGWN